MQKDANLVELEKCCQTHIFLQNFVLIQPRTSPLKIYEILQNLPILLTLTRLEEVLAIPVGRVLVAVVQGEAEGEPRAGGDLRRSGAV